LAEHLCAALDVHPGVFGPFARDDQLLRSSTISPDGRPADRARPAGPQQAHKLSRLALEIKGCGSPADGGRPPDDI
jgi:hypothetical protein